MEKIQNRLPCFSEISFFSLTASLTVLISLIEGGLWASLHFELFDKNSAEIVHLTMLMLPSLLFLCLFSLCSGLLQCEKKFFITGIAPIGLNIVWISAVWLLRDLPPHQAVIPLSLSIVLACFLQWMVTFPTTVRFLSHYLNWKEMIQATLFSKGMRAMLGSISLGVIGVCATQVNSAIDTLFARYASLQGPAFLNYAIHLQQLPLALFGIGISAALLPPLSRAIQANNFEKYRELLDFALSNALLLLIPCSLAIFALGGPSINLIYGRGDFDTTSTIQTTLCLWGYGIGLVPMAISILVTPAFYSKKDFWTPTVASLLSIGFNILLNFLFVILLGFGPATLAVSTSIAAAFNAHFLFVQLKRKTGISLYKSMMQKSWKVTLASTLATLVTLVSAQFLFSNTYGSLIFGDNEIYFPRQ